MNHEFCNVHYFDYTMRKLYGKHAEIIVWNSDKYPACTARINGVTKPVNTWINIYENPTKECTSLELTLKLIVT